METKAALEIERDRAVELAEKSLQSIDTITNTGNFYLQVIAILIGLAALAGLAAVYVGSRREAKRVADERIDAYIKSEAGQTLIQKAIAAEVETRIAESITIAVRPPVPSPKEEGGFPEKPIGRPATRRPPRRREGGKAE